MPSHKYNKTRKIHRKKGGSLGNHAIDEFYPNPEKRSPLKIPSIFQSLLNNTRKVNSTMQNQKLKDLKKVYIEPLQKNLDFLNKNYKPKNIEIKESNIIKNKKEKIEEIMKLINIYNENVNFQEKNPLLKETLQNIISEKNELENIINEEIKQINKLKKERQKRIENNKNIFKDFLNKRKTKKHKNTSPTQPPSPTQSPSQSPFPKNITIDEYIKLIRKKPVTYTPFEIKKQKNEKNINKLLEKQKKIREVELEKIRREAEAQANKNPKKNN